MSETTSQRERCVIRVLRAYAGLTDRERSIVAMRIGIGQERITDFETIADRHRLTSSRARQVFVSAVEKMGPAAAGVGGYVKTRS